MVAINTMPKSRASHQPAVEAIRLKGVRQNNLKGFDLELPLGQLIVVTGLSGAGKSSLVFETLHAEGQRRYVETFSPYTRQFLERQDRPDVESIENIRPSIAIQQSNTVKTSRSSVGTMTELCDYFKVWFCHVSSLYDPQTGELVEDDNPQSIWKKILKTYSAQTVLIGFEIKKPSGMQWQEILASVSGQGFGRILLNGKMERLAEMTPDAINAEAIVVIADRIKIESGKRKRFIEAATQALHFGQGHMLVYPNKGLHEPLHFSTGLHSPGSGMDFKPATPGLFSFNSPIGACPKCRGFGRVIEIDYNLVIPDKNLSLNEGAIKPFQGKVYSESLRDLSKGAGKAKVRMDVPWKKLTQAERDFVVEGDPDYGKGNKAWPHAWYGVRRFFEWLESNTYKMHVRVFLSKFRSYNTCSACGGTRLCPEALNWKWRGYTLPGLYQMPIGDLYNLLKDYTSETGNHQADLAAQGILTRLGYLVEVGLDYLTLDRTSRTLSGGEVQRVNLTTCLGTSLTDTLFVLDEPSIGLHSRDISRLIGILKRLASQGNTVVVVEHDEAVMRVADHLIEIGPEPGSQGGHVVFQGSYAKILKTRSSLTGRYLGGSLDVAAPTGRRSTQTSAQLRIRSASLHNLSRLNVDIPLKRLVCLSGVSGSGKSTLMENVIHQGLLRERGRSVSEPADIKSIKTDIRFSEILRVDQGPVSKTPRSNPALYSETWDDIRNLFARTDAAKTSGFTASHFSFNSGEGRCEHCNGLGFEKVEMQFLSDVYVTCPICEGQRFKPEILAVKWNGKSVADVLGMTVGDACAFFNEKGAILHRLQGLVKVGLGYLPLGQPLNTLSGGESQRLKLVKYLNRADADSEGALLLLDEPTTGLHRDDIRRLIAVLQELVELGHSLIVIEHQLDILKCADWIIELGPGAGARGGKVVFEGTPEAIADAKTESTLFMREALGMEAGEEPELMAAEGAVPFKTTTRRRKHGTQEYLRIQGAREHNLRNVSIDIPHREMTVVTGVSGSGKSSLAFDIVFAEGQRRFMESMASYARQFVEQLPRPDVDAISGIPPTVAIEQRVTRGSRKSTVATVTEVAQYLRLLYARIGIPYSAKTGKALVSQTAAEITRSIKKSLAKNPQSLLAAPVIRSRKGHYQPLADWARDHGYKTLRIDGQLVALNNFKKLDRYREHDIEIVTASLSDGVLELHGPPGNNKPTLNTAVSTALKLGKGSCVLLSQKGDISGWYSTERADPATGEAIPELDPKHFSWNSPKGWCPTCRGYGALYSWMDDREEFEDLKTIEDGESCPDCGGSRLNEVSRNVFLPLQNGKKLSLPELLAMPSADVMTSLNALDLNTRNKAIAKDIIPEINERLRFLDQVGLGYLTLDRASSTLSGGEAQRIRLASQLGSNLSGVLYVLDEPSIGLHARDNQALIESLRALQAKSNTLLIVEHDDETMRAADRIIDLGPGAGTHGGQLQANAPWREIIRNRESLTGRYLSRGMPHPLRGSFRKLPAAYSPRRKSTDWLVLKNPKLRNLKGNDLRLPIGRLTVVCGISGAGKSTLIRDTLKPAVATAIKKKSARLGGDKNVFAELINGNAFRQCVEVDQEPIGKTPRSTPATYIGAFDIIREVFASLPEAQMHGYTAGTFSFNTKGGRCETCSGAGRIKLEMSFMPDAYTSCDDCQGRRYGPEMEDIQWHEKNIADVLAMTFEQAADFFSFHSRLGDMLQLMVDTGLGYLTLGQSSPTLSGGEAQRLKLVSELAKGLPSFREKSRGISRKSLYILEEPTIGLHMSDCERLIELLHRLVDQGNTVVVIEHNLDVIAEADYLVEVGPDGGAAGGRILYQGATKGLLQVDTSPTRPFLEKLSKALCAFATSNATGNAK